MGCIKTEVLCAPPYWMMCPSRTKKRYLLFMIVGAAVLREIISVCISFWFSFFSYVLVSQLFLRIFVTQEIIMQFNGNFFLELVDYQWRPHLKTISSLSKF